MSDHAPAPGAFAATVRARHAHAPATVRRARFALVRPVVPIDAHRAPRSTAPPVPSRPLVTHHWSPRITLHLGRLERTLMARSHRIVRALPTATEPNAREMAPAARIAATATRHEALTPDTLARRLVQAPADGTAAPTHAPLLRRVERVVARSAAAPAAATPAAAPPRPASPATPAMNARPEAAFSERDVARLTDSVVRSIEQRIRAQRERMGRA